MRGNLRKRIWRLIVPLVLLSSGSVLAADVALTLRDAEGRLLKGAEVELTDSAVTRAERGKQKPLVVTCDAEGLAKFKWPAGTHRINVHARGIGYGMTGRFEFVDGRANAPAVPPLVPSSSISGKAPKELLKAGAECVVTEAGYWNQHRFAMAADGTFVAADLPPGAKSLVVVAGKETLTAQQMVPLGPGEHVTGIVLAPVPPAQVERRKIQLAEQKEREERREANRDRKIIWASGTVRDERGEPIAGVKVYAVAVYHGGMRMCERVENASTDGKGFYRITGAADLYAFSATLVAHGEGRQAAMQWIDGPQESADLPRKAEAGGVAAKPIARRPGNDFTLVRGGCKLEVLVLKEGKPAIGAAVAIKREGSQLRDVWAMGAEHPELDAVLYPARLVDASGIARFDTLPGGRYEVSAGLLEHNGISIGGQALQAETFARHAFERKGFLNEAGPQSRAEGVSVRPGETASFSMALRQPDYHVSLQFRGIKGKPLGTGQQYFSWSSIARGGWQSGIKLDEAGTGTIQVEGLGMHQVECKVSESGARVDDRFGPFDRAGGWVAVSPLLGMTRTPVITAVHYQPGTTVVTVLDTLGKPLPAMVEIRQSHYEPEAQGVTDQQGVIRMEGVNLWRHFSAYASPLNRPALNLGNPLDPIPTDDALKKMTFIPPQPAQVPLNSEVRLTLQEKRAAFLRGTLRAPAGHHAREYFVVLDRGPADLEHSSRYIEDTGEYLIGPLLEGDYTLYVYAKSNDGRDSLRCGEQKLHLASGEIVHHDPVPQKPEPSQAPETGNMLLGVNGISSQAMDAKRLAGKVFLPDGKTPAAGAIVLYFPASSREPAFQGVTDVLGVIHPRGLWTRGESEDQKAADLSAEPRVIAILPGAHGGISVKADGRPLAISLPPAVTARGKVTAGGKAIEARHGAINVVARYVGETQLVAPLSVETTARADGSFELAGLSPGIYKVQAGMDELWFSDVVTLEVGRGELAAMKLDVGLPGAPVAIKLTDGKGAAVIGRMVTIDGREGPLEAELRPAAYSADGAGIAYIPTLEAGRHTVRVANSTIAQVIDVVKRGEADPVEVSITVK